MDNPDEYLQVLVYGSVKFSFWEESHQVVPAHFQMQRRQLSWEFHPGYLNNVWDLLKTRPDASDLILLSTLKILEL